MKALIPMLPFLLLVGGNAATAQELAEGEALYNDKCLYCHNIQGTGTTMLGKRLGEEKALLSERTDLNDQYIKTVLRYGVGSMPWYRRTEITDADAAAIARYLIRNNQTTSQ